MSSPSICAGYNQPLGNLLPIALIKVNGRAFAEPKVQYYYSPGKRLIRADGSVYDTGYPTVVWHFGIMYFDQYPYLQSAYATGGWGGQVTILTTLNDVTYSRMNAAMIIPQQTELKSHMGWYVDVPVQFTRLVASS
jgi:hypothetical protein